MPWSPVAGGNYRQMVAIHQMQSHRMHSRDGPIGTQRFLTWHRVYLSALQAWIRTQYNPNFFIPYWNWVENPSIPSRLENFTPLIVVPDTETVPPTSSSYQSIYVYRNPGEQGFLPTQGYIDYLFTNNHEYTDFTLYLEWLHNNVHAWVGGTMSIIDTFPADPLFWLHHANIDRIWSIWQKDNPNQNPILSAPDQVMDPWPSTEPMWRIDPTSEYV